MEMVGLLLEGLLLLSCGEFPPEYADALHYKEKEYKLKNAQVMRKRQRKENLIQYITTITSAVARVISAYPYPCGGREVGRTCTSDKPQYS